jgi:diguanylate cyclase (GGDEF)-like protein
MNVLLVEHDPDELSELGLILEGQTSPPMELERASELSEALKRLSRGGIDVVLLDLDLPDSKGIVTFERTHAFAPDVPVVVMTDSRDRELDLEIVRGGAQDHLRREEATRGVLLRTLRYAVERHRLMSALKSLSLIDELTGLYNRRGFSDIGDQQLKLARRNGRDVTLVYADLDRFRTINDSLGHLVGDRALLKVADILRASFRQSDVLARIGGDQFAVLALEAPGEDAEVLAERVREGVRFFNETSREPFRLSLSIGLALHMGYNRIRLEELLADAERRAQEEKEAKKQKVMGT